MVKWIGRFPLSFQRSRDVWMDNLPMSSMSEEQGQGHHLADVAQENAERLTRGVELLDPNTPENRERWNTAQVNDHESLFPLRLTSSLSLKGMNIHCLHLLSSKDNISGIMLYAEKLDGKPFTPRERPRQQYEQNLHRRRLS